MLDPRRDYQTAMRYLCEEHTAAERVHDGPWMREVEETIWLLQRGLLGPDVPPR